MSLFFAAGFENINTQWLQGNIVRFKLYDCVYNTQMVFGSRFGIGKLYSYFAVLVRGGVFVTSLPHISVGKIFFILKKFFEYSKRFF